LSVQLLVLCKNSQKDLQRIYNIVLFYQNHRPDFGTFNYKFFSRNFSCYCKMLTYATELAFRRVCSQVETPNGAKRQEAHRTPRGKRVAWSGNQLLLKATMYAKTAFRKNNKKPASQKPV
jgi:hypothetical protein